MTNHDHAFLPLTLGVERMLRDGSGDGPVLLLADDLCVARDSIAWKCPLFDQVPRFELADDTVMARSICGEVRV
jgi:hypothetical protein